MRTTERCALSLIAITHKAAVIALLTIASLLVLIWPPLTAKSVTLGDDAQFVHNADPSGIALVAVARAAEKPKPTPAPVTNVACGIKAGDFSQYRAMVIQEFGAGHVMVRIADAESDFDPTAKNCGSTATGIFQILVGTWADYGCVGSRTDAHDNIQCARIIYEESGTVPWNSSSANW